MFRVGLSQTLDLNASLNGGAADTGVTYEAAPGSAAVLTVNSSTGVITPVAVGAGVVLVKENGVTIDEVFVEVLADAEMTVRDEIEAGTKRVSVAAEVVPAGPITWSFSTGSTVPGYPASNVVDKNGGTFWLSHGQDHPLSIYGSDYIQIEFSAGVSFSTINITTRNDGWGAQEAPKNFEIRASSDDMATYDVVYTSGGEYWGPGVMKSFSNPNPSKKYKQVRIHITSTQAPGYNYTSIAEIDILDSSAVSIL